MRKGDPKKKLSGEGRVGEKAEKEEEKERQRRTEKNSLFWIL